MSWWSASRLFGVLVYGGQLQQPCWAHVVDTVKMAEVLADLRTLIPAEVVNGFSDLNDFYKWLPFAYVFAGHCLFCAMPAIELRDRCFVHYVVRAQSPQP
jgi:hypothetical protein